MRHLKRFRNWLTNAYYGRALPQQLGISDFCRDERVAEQTKGDQAAADVILAESVAIVATQTSQRSTALRSSVRSEPSQAQAAMPIQPAASKPIPKKIVKEVTSKNEERVAPVAEPKKAITPAREGATVPGKSFADEWFAVSEPKARAPQIVATDVQPQGAEANITDEVGAAPIAEHEKIFTPTESVPRVPRKTVAAEPSAPKTQVPQADAKPQGANGNSTAVISAKGKYDPGTIDDQTAQRLARLLISEIKLYNMNKIESAGEMNNIYDSLKGPIDKSRQHYLKRLGDAINMMPDYFHVELVRSLCAGDPSRLGPNYPAS